MSARWWGLALVALVLAVALGPGCASGRRGRPPPADVVMLGIWDRTKPMLEKLASEKRLRVRSYTPQDASAPGFAARLGSPRFLFVLNAPAERTNQYEQLVKDAHAAGARVIALDQRDWQGAMRKSGVIETDEELNRYWKYSGVKNVSSMLDYIDVRWLGGLRPLRPPTPTPADGLYHPDADDVFDGLTAYQAWYAGHRPLPADAPKVAYIVHQSFITLEETADIDAMVRAFEARGVAIYCLFAESEAALRKTLVALHPALVMTQRHVGLGKPADGGTPIPATLGVPYLKPVSALQTTVDEWRRRPEGLMPGDMANQVTAQELEGTIEPLVVSALASTGEYRTQYPIEERVDHFADRALAWIRLQRTPAADKRLAIVYYNAELGGDGLARGSVSGMFLDAPASLVDFTRALAARGYQVTPPADAAALVARMSEHGRNLGPWAQADIDRLAASGQAVLIKRADYVTWFERDLGDSLRAQVVRAYGPPPGQLMTTSIHGEPELVIPRVELGPGVTLFPQPEKGPRQDSRLVHDSKVPPSHQYVAFYLWLREVYRPHAIVHFGTHGTLELLPRRAAGLGPDDFADALLGTTPNLNPWILDNVAEATLARRRAYAVLIDHLVPPIERTVVGEALRKLHEDCEKLLGLEPGPVREAFRGKLVTAMRAQGFAMDLVPGGTDTLTDEAARELDLRLHAVVEEQAPRTLHVLGRAPPADRRPRYLAAILGRDAVARMGGPAAAEAMIACATRGGEPAACAARAPAARRAEVEADLGRAVTLDADLQRAPDEVAHTLDALDGKYVPPGPGNDPVRNPAAIPTGRNLYALDPEQVPTEPAMAVASQVVRQTIDAHVAKHGRPPRKLAINLNGFETMRDTGVTEAQVLAYVGAEPIRDDRGRVTDVRLVERSKLDRPRVDVVLAISGAYRDNFATRVKLLDKAIRLAQASPEPDNVLAQDTAEALAALLGKGMAPEQAQKLARARIFGQAPGQYGTQILHLVPRSGAWADRKEIAQVYRENMHFAYGEDTWGEPSDDGFTAAMANTDAVSHVWASNMMSPLTNHHVYEYVGGLSLAVTAATGKQPDAIIADVRDPSRPRARDLAEVISTEGAVRLLNPRWIADMKASGYAGGGHVAAYVENLFGWESTVAGSVDSAMFARVEEAYLRDGLEPGTRAWLERDNPDALLDVTTTLVESARRGYYQLDDAGRERLVADYMRQVAERGPPTGMMGGGNEALAEYVRRVSDAPTSKIDRATVAAYRARVEAARRATTTATASLQAAVARTPPLPTRASAPTVEGVKMERVVEAPAPPRRALWIVSGAVLAVVVSSLGFGLVHFRPRPRRRSPKGTRA